MERETRSDIMFRHLNEFLAREEKETSMILYKNEVRRLEKNITEQNISVEITEKIELKPSKLRITIKKKDM